MSGIGKHALRRVVALQFGVVEIHQMPHVGGRPPMVDQNRPGALARAHRFRDVRACDIVVVRGLPLLSPIRAAWCEATRLSRLPAGWGVPRLERVVDDLHRAHLLTWEELHESIRCLGRRGRSGTGLMQSIAAEREPGTSTTESRLEDRFAEVLEEAGAAAVAQSGLSFNATTDENNGGSAMNPHPLDADGRSDEYDTAALIEDMREIFRRQTRTFMLTLLAMTLLLMTSTVISHVWS